MKKVLVIGCSGVGKTTLAARVSQKTGLPFTATDPFYWRAHWQLASTESVVHSVDEATRRPAWVLDGNFDGQRELVWRRADTIVWLDYPLWRVLPQVVTRNLGLWLSQKPTWSGNRMTWKRAWSGVRHALRSHELKHRNYPAYLSEFPNVRVLRFRHPGEADAWLATLLVA